MVFSQLSDSPVHNSTPKDYSMFQPMTAQFGNIDCCDIFLIDWIVWWRMICLCRCAPVCLNAGRKPNGLNYIDGQFVFLKFWRLLKSVYFKNPVAQSSVHSKLWWFSIIQLNQNKVSWCIIENDHIFEWIEDRTTVFLTWTDLSQLIGG